MSGPKHLWSGDWEHESRALAAAPPVAPNPESEPPDAAPAHRAPVSRRHLAIALTAGIAAAAATVALALTLGGSSKPPANRHRPTASIGTPTTPAPATGSGGHGLTAPPPACSTTAAATSTSACSTGGAAQAPAASGPTATWMGMQIVTSPSGVVVSTVQLGSIADQAGVEPGDQIESVNGHLIGSVSELRPDTNGVKIGGHVTIDVMRSSVQLSLASIPMTQRPTIHP
ncbi:MAG TPA: PDZ domain-containing protein [Solirubrobacteraceae bacterium]|nr:PDZ domain-containing protein [Solirubrobacteraceae bacterium]